MNTSPDAAVISAPRRFARLSFWLATVLLLLFWLSRVHNLLALPIFLDEASHITRAQWVWQGRPLYLLETGKMLAPYLAALFWPFSAAPFIGRYVVILLGAIGLASGYAVGRELHSRYVGLLCMALWIISPQIMFFERMALVDTTISAMAMLSLWLAIRMVRSGSLRTAALCGLGLALCLFAKTTGLVFLPIPVLAALALGKRAGWKRYLRQIALAYGIVVLLAIGPLIYIQCPERDSAGRCDAADPTGLKYGLTTVNTSTLSDRVSANFADTWNAEQIYFSKWMLGIVLGSVVVLAVYAPRRLLLLLLPVLALLGAIIATAASLWLRYTSPAAPFLVLIAAYGLTAVAEQIRKAGLPRIIYAAPWLVAAAWAILVGLPFQLAAYQDPVQLTPMMPSRDVVEYLQWIPSGFGVRDAAQYIQKNYTTPITVVGTAVNCNSARLYIPLGSPVTFFCPETIDWGGANNDWIIAEMVKHVEKEGKVLVLGETYGPYRPIVREGDLPRPHQEVKRFARPARDYTVILYQITGPLEASVINDPAQ